MNRIRKAIKWVTTFTPPSPTSAIVVDQGAYDPRSSKLQQATTRVTQRVFRIGGALLAAVAIVLTMFGAFATASHADPVGDTICKALGGENTGYEVAPINSAGSLLAPKNYRTVEDGTSTESPGSTDPGAYTWAEEARGVSLRWSTTTEEHKESSQKENSCDLGAVSENASANNIFGLGQTISNLGAYVRSVMTSGVSPFDSLYSDSVPCRYEGCSSDTVATDGPLAKLINNLRDAVFIPSLTVSVLGTGIWILFQYKQENHRKAIAGFMWLCVSAILSAFLLFNHRELVAGAQNATAKAVAAADGGISWMALNGGDPPDASGGTVGYEGVPIQCQLKPESEEDQKVPASTRTSSCMIWYTFSYTPWVQGQFGSTPETEISTKVSTGSDVNGRYSFQFAQMRSQAYLLIDFYRGDEAGGEKISKADLDAERERRSIKTENGTIPISYQEACEHLEGAWLAQGTNWFGAPDANKGTCVKNSKTGFIAKGKLWEDLRDELKERKGAASMYSTWKGDTVSDRTNVAVGTTIASSFYSGTVIFASALTLFWEALQHFLLIILPLVAAIATWPPLQKILRGWGETFLKSFILRIALGLVTALLMGLYVVVFLNVVGMWQQVLLFVLFGIATIWLINYLRSDVTTPNLSGGSTDVEKAAQQPMQYMSQTGGKLRDVAVAGAGYAFGSRNKGGSGNAPMPDAADSNGDQQRRSKSGSDEPTRPTNEKQKADDRGTSDDKTQPENNPEGQHKQKTDGRRTGEGPAGPDSQPPQSDRPSSQRPQSDRPSSEASNSPESSGSGHDTSSPSGNGPQRRTSRDVEAPEPHRSESPRRSESTTRSAPDEAQSSSSEDSQPSGSDDPPRRRRNGGGDTPPIH